MRIALITGGPSAEREVALTSGAGILKALRESGHDVIVIDPIYGVEQPPETELFGDGVGRDFPTVSELNKFGELAKKNIVKCFAGDLFDDVDVAFLALHGKFGEDGKVQTLLEMRGIPYTGSGVFASALAMDKDIAKIVLRSAYVRTPRSVAFSGKDSCVKSDLRSIIEKELPYPCVVKPNDEGSTVGLTIIQDSEGIDAAVETAFEYSDKILVEQYISGRELTVPVIGCEAFPVVEIRPKGGFYDYEHKYTKGMTEYFCPAELSAEIESAARNAALRSHDCLGCEVYSRVDFILGDDGELYCLEVNTLPGMTPTSLVPKSAAALGMSFQELILKIIDLSISRNS